jgi:hypothetical protein
MTVTTSPLYTARCAYIFTKFAKNAKNAQCNSVAFAQKKKDQE